MWAKKSEGIHRVLEMAAHKTTMWVGSSWALLVALGMVVAWLITGPVYHYSDTWQLVMNTITALSPS
jgi:low affinity Fe/Cu permease